MPIRFHPEAELEMVEAAVWYETQQGDLGKRFLAAIQDVLNKIEVNPKLYPVVEGDVRRCLVKIFPFGVLFWIMPDAIVCTFVETRITGRREKQNNRLLNYFSQIKE